MREEKQPGLGPTPHYPGVPQWGLTDRPVTVDAPVRESLAAEKSLRTSFVIASAVFLLFALAGIARYCVLIVNRTRPIPGWADATTETAVVALGLIAIAAVAASAVAAMWWLLVVRRDIYRDGGTLDPRPAWQIALLMLVPLVNLVGAPVLLTETAAARSGGVAQVDARTAGRIKQLTVAWAIVNVVALIAFAWRIAAGQTGLIQTGADALAWVALSALVSAAFAFWASRRLPRVFAEPDVEVSSSPPRRLVVVG